MAPPFGAPGDALEPDITERASRAPSSARTTLARRRSASGLQVTARVRRRALPIRTSIGVRRVLYVLFADMDTIDPSSRVRACAGGAGRARGRAPDGAREPRTSDPGDVGAAGGERAAGNADRPGRGARDPGRGDPGGDRGQSGCRRSLVRGQPARGVRRDRRPDARGAGRAPGARPRAGAGHRPGRPRGSLGSVRRAVRPSRHSCRVRRGVGITAIAGAPITVGDDVWGFLLVATRAGDPSIVETGAELLHGFATITATAVGRTQAIALLERSHDALESAVAERTLELTQVVEELSRANRTKSEFLSNVARRARRSPRSSASPTSCSTGWRAR